MNSRERRATDRYWAYQCDVIGDTLEYECRDWLLKNFGSCNLKRLKKPRWCYRPVYDYSAGNFTQFEIGSTVFFHYEKDYVAFLLKWDR